MTTIQIIGLIVVALLGLYVFYCIYDLNKFNKKKDHRHKNKVLMLGLLFVALFAGQDAWATSDFTVAIQSGSTFRITRTGNTSVSETVDWRVVSLSAIAGIHFSGNNGNYHGTVSFGVNETYKDVTITERSLYAEDPNGYKFYKDDIGRTYRFEVLDKNGDIMAYCDRKRNIGDCINSTNAFGNHSLTINSGTITVTDGGYAQAHHDVTVDNYYNAAAPKKYFLSAGAQLLVTVTFNAREEDDGYQYVQIYANTPADNDHTDTGAKNGDPGSYNYARYVAGFTIDGNVSSTYYPYTFPVTAYGHACGYHAHPWSGNSNGNLEQQYFQSNCRASDGRLIVPTDLSSLYVRLNASGNWGDTWSCQNLTAHIQAADNAAPTVLNNYKVSEGRHQKGNTFYVSVPFSEIVVVTGTPKLNSTWGEISYYYGSGTNVLTFKGTIKSDATDPLNVTSYSLNSGTIKDLAGNSFSSSSTAIKHNFGTALDDDYAWSTSDFRELATNTYEIYTKMDLRHLALLVNKAHNYCSGLTFQQSVDITCDNTYIPIGYKVSSSDNAYFRGTYDGQGHTVSGITVTRTGTGDANGYVGLFGYIDYNSYTDYGTVRNVVLASSTFTGCNDVGGIVGLNWGGTVENCRVESSVTINAGANGALYHGGIVGHNYSVHSRVIGCYSAAAISVNDKSNCQQYGGIVGKNYGGTVKDCLYTGTAVTADNRRGAIIGLDEDNHGVFSNNYYTDINLGGVGADGSSSDQDGARRARTVTLGANVVFNGDETVYNVSGITAIGTGNYAIRYNNTLYSGATQNLTFSHSGLPGTGYAWIGFSATGGGTFSGNILTMPDDNVTVTANKTDVWGVTNSPAADGSEEHPYLISDTTGLNLLARNVNGTHGYTPNNFYGKFFKLANDITYNTTGLGENESNYTAIGLDESIRFDGTFDGNNNTISGIRIYKSNDDYQGLFGWIQGSSGASCGAVKRVIVNDAVIHGRNYVGGISGYVSSDLENCLVLSSTLSGTSQVGAILGYKTNLGYIIYSNHYRGCTVNGTANAANVATGSGDIPGGRSLHALSLGANISVTGNETVVIDEVTYYASASTITLSYNVAIPAGYKMTFKYNDGSDHAISGNSFTMPSADITVSAVFTDVWGVTSGHDGTTEATAYLISDTTGLNVLAQCVNGTHGYTANDFSSKFFKLGDNITYTYNTAWNNDSSTENNYTAIGKGSRSFRGTFDGDGKTISGIRIYKSGTDMSVDGDEGLFGYVNSGTVKNVTLTDARITGFYNTGGIVGDFSYGTIENCNVTASVAIYAVAYSFYHGGIVGSMSNNSATISGCTSAAQITRADGVNLRYAGGIVGSYTTGTVKDCLVIGATISGNDIGAIVGNNDPGALTNNYYTAIDLGGVQGSDCDGARRARVITLSDNVGIAGDQTAYDVSGLTAMGSSTLSYNDGTTTTIYSGATQTVTLSDAAPQGYAVTSYSLNGTPLEGNAFTMPDSDVTVSATIGVPYIDADGNEQVCTDYTLVESSTGNTVTLGAVGTETWCAVSGNVNITVSDDQAIKTYGAVHLILMDGATLTVEGQFSIFTFGSLSIYGQSLGTGSLVASSDGTAIYVGESLSNPVVNDGGLTINGGIITTISSNSHNIYAYDITINGGSVSANGGGINANGALTLGWRNATDRIYASSYNGDNGVAVKSGQYLSDGTAVYSGSLSDTQIDALAGKTLQPAVALTLPKYVDATSGVLVQEGRTACVLPGANVTIAAEGCTLTNVTVGGEAATDNGDGTWSFIMPANDVTVSATVTAIDFTTGHAGTEGDPYIIMYRSQLDLLATRVNGGESYDGKFLKLGADIAYDPIDLDDNGENYTAIGTKVNYRYFNGSFDGDGHIVSGIRINKTGQTDADKKQGLFGYVYNAFIKNVVLSDASITGYKQVGGIVGDISSNNTIQNCLVLNSHITAANNTTNKGAIAGYYTSSLTLTDNYYYNCTVNGASTNVGADGNDRDGARGVNKLTLCEHVIATPAAAVTYQGNGYYVAGTSVTLSVEEGYTLNGSYTVKDANNNDVALTGGDTFEMPASDVTVSADITVTTMAGSGTENDPWIIMYRSQMDQLAISEINNGEYYQLGRDLTYSYEGLGETESNYTPILVNAGGHFDGAGHTISGIRIYPYDNLHNDNKGLFSVNYGTVKNVTLTDAIITGDDYVGGIVGSNTKNGLIDSCHVTSTVIIKAYGYASDYHGGISGDNAGGVGKIPSIRNCTSAATITNNGYENCIDYGGIVGENVGGIVSGCTVYEANITATDVAGGIVGYNYCCCGFEDPVVENCFAIDCTINSGSAGAIISNSNHGTLNHNYYYNCTVNDNTTDIGTYEGDIGEMTYNSVTYYDGAVQVFSITLGEHITATATAAHSYSGNNFYKAGTSVTLSPEEGYAISGGYTVNGTPLVGNTFEMPASDVTVSASIVPDYATWWHADADHDGTTEERAYIITTTTGLNLLASEVNDGNSFSGTFFKLGADIEYDPAILVNGENYTAIGGHFNSNDYAFSGTFDGDGYKVSGIRIHREGVAASTARCKGLFGVASNATIKNVILSDAQIYACSHVGGIVANLIGNNTIEHCLVLNSQITATGDSTPYCGVITGNYTNNVTLTGNYYYNCSLTRDNNTYTNDIGTGSYPVTDRDGARSIHALTLGDSISATPAAAVTYNNNSYYTAGTEVTLSYSGTVPEGERALFSVNGTYISGNTFVIADEDVTVAVDVLPRYSYDTTTKALSLYWGEYNAANHWGNEVVKSEVTSITGTNQVSFTGDCNLLFYEYVNCTSIDLHDANTADMTNCSYMFHVLPSLTSLKLSGWNTGNVATMRSMFNRCSALTSLDLSGWDTGNVTTMYEMFDGCSSLTSLDLSGWDTGNVTSMWWMFFNCSSLTSLDLSGWNTANVVDLENMFHNCSNLTTLDLSGWNTAKVTGMEYLFSGCSSLTSLNLSGWNTEKVTAMHEMFMGCTNLTTITGISGWNTAKVTRMKDMFSGCSSLTSLDLSGWNTGKVTTMEQMFNGCTNLTTLYASGWNTAKVTTMANMFNGCTNLTTITGITGWNTSNVESMNSMFASCTGLTTLDLSGWNTAKVTTLAGMFDQCTNLTTLNLSGWNTAAVKEFQIMFNLCSKLQTIYVSSLWNTNAKVNWGDNMFEECTSLVGGNGTVYNGSFTDIEYARIDEPGHPGYLTLAPNTVTLTKSIVGYGANNNVTTGWHLIASPLAGRTWVTNVANLTKNTYDLYRFDQSAEMEWQNYKAHQNDVDNPFHALENGQGYLYANSGDVTLSFVGTPYSGNGQVTLAKDNNASLSGWNLVGNPFAQTAYIDRDFYVMNNDGSDIVVAARADHHVEAMEGIFVQADEDGEKLTFSTTAPSKGRGQTSELEQIVIELSTLNAQLSTPVIDRAIVRFDEGRQLPKLQLFEGNTKLYIPQDGKEYAIAYSNGVEEMPLCFKAKKNGEYTLSVSGTESGEWKVESGKLKVESGKWKVLRLIDNLTGADIDLLATPSYTFTARNDDYASRFKLVFNANENDNQNENEDFAFISDGEIIVNGEGTVQVIDVTGHVLVTGRANRNISTTGFVPGVYVVRLTNATKSKTQKIIIK